MQIDDSIYQRFDARNTAFQALSRRLGRDWRDEMRESALSLVAESKAGLKKALRQPDDALFHYGFKVGFGVVDDLATDWGLGRTSVRALRDAELPTELAARRCIDKARLTREMRRVAHHCGAVLTGVTNLDIRWIYAGVDVPSENTVSSQDAEDGARDGVGEELALPKGIKHVIVIAVRMDRGMVSTAPSLLAEAATTLGYSRAAFCVLSLAAYIRAIGYQAIPCLNDTALSIPLAVAAGLGELGRNGLLITPEYGPCVRLAKVMTDMPLLVDHPVDYGIQAYCHACGECARQCRVGAISDGEPSYRGHSVCNNDGVLKWYVDAPKCLRYWMASGTSCSACIAICPFTLGKKWWFGLPQWLIRHTRRLDGLIAWLDRCFSSRKHIEARDYLARDLV